MTEGRTGRELEPLPEDRSVTPVPERPASVERFDAGARAHTVGLNEERSAQIVRQSGNARTIGFLAAIIVALFIPIYWFYDIGIPALAVEGRLEQEGEVQYVTDVSRGYALYLANCARCHGENGEGGVGPALNDQDKLYNALTPDRLPGNGHLNPNYLHRVLEVGGRYVCGDPNSVMPAWLQPNGPLNYREVEELIAFLTASSDIEFTHDPAAHGEVDEAAGTPHPVTGWRDPNYQPDPAAPTPPACWRNPSGQVGGGGGQPSAAPVESPGTADAPRVIALDETANLEIVQQDEGAEVSQISVVPGEVIRFEVTNSAGFSHNFLIGPPEPLEQNNTGELEGIEEFTEGEREYLWTVPDEVEGLQFACTVPGHYPTMHGDFVAVESGGGGGGEASPGASAEPGASGETSPGATVTPGTTMPTAAPVPSGSPATGPQAPSPAP